MNRSLSHGSKIKGVKLCDKKVLSVLYRWWKIIIMKSLEVGGRDGKHIMWIILLSRSKKGLVD